MTRKTIQISADTFDTITDICQQNPFSKFALTDALLRKALTNKLSLSDTIDELTEKEEEKEIKQELIEKALLEMSAEDLKVLLQKRLRR